MRRRLTNLVLTLALVAIPAVAVPSSVFAASTGCATATYTVNFAIKFNGSVDSTGFGREKMSYCWTDPNPRPKGAGPLAGQTATYSCPGCVSVNKSYDNHDQLFNVYDYSYQANFSFNKLTCQFHLNMEIWVDGAQGNAAGKVRDLYTAGTCTGWTIVVTSTSG
jgi:hypothetical protein